MIQLKINIFLHINFFYWDISEFIFFRVNNYCFTNIIISYKLITFMTHYVMLLKLST